MEINKQNCPICNSEIQHNARYPRYVCNECYHKATDNNGRKVIFGNVSLSGGCEGIYPDTKEKYKYNICYIEGHECIADEAKFGGIVIEKK